MHVGSVSENSNGNKKWKIALFLCFLGLVLDGADVMILSLSLNSIRNDFGLSSTEAGFLGTITVLSLAVGGLFGGWASDRFGRVKVIATSILIFSILTGFLGMTRTVTEFAILRALSGLGLGCVYIVSVGLIAEYVPTIKRATMLSILGTGYTVGYIVASLIAGNVIPEFGWRPAYMLFWVGIFLAFIMYAFIPESESWKNSKKNIAEIAKTEKVESRLGFLLRDKAVLKILLLWLTVSAVFHVGYTGVNHWMPTFVETELNINYKAMTYYMIASWTAMIGGKLFAGYLGDKFGRRFSYMFGCIASAICLMLIIFFNSPANILFFLVAFGFLYGIPFGVYGTYMSESFPSYVRGTALGLAHNGGRIGSSIGPLLVGVITAGSSLSVAFFVLALAYAICFVPLFFVREKMYDPQTV